MIFVVVVVYFWCYFTYIKKKIIKLYYKFYCSIDDVDDGIGVVVLSSDAKDDKLLLLLVDNLFVRVDESNGEFDLYSENDKKK